MEITIILIILGATLIIAELFIGIESGLDLLLIGSCILLGGIVGHYAGSGNIAIGVAGILSVVYLFLGRKYVKNKMEIYDHSSNVDNLLGKITKVKTWNSEKQIGEVSIEGETWRISSEDKINAGDTVKIVNIDGVTLIVKPE